MFAQEHFLRPHMPQIHVETLGNFGYHRCRILPIRITYRDIDTLEKVQRRATKHLRGLAHLTYESRLEILDLYSLYCRRQRGDMIETYKILKQHYDLDPSTFFTLNTATTRGHSLKLFKERSRLLVRQNFFTNRIVNLWNSLPDFIISAPTVATFKLRLDNFWKQSRYGHLQRPAA